MTEQWRPVPEWEDRYMISDLGRVRSVGKRGRILVTRIHKGYPTVTFCRGRAVQKTCMIHQLVARAFIGPKPFAGAHVRHLDGDKANNTLSNLAYGTASENMYDRTRLGEDHQSIRTHCDEGHPFDELNTYLRTDGGGRCCRTCRRRHVREYEHRRRGGVGTPMPHEIRQWALSAGLPIRRSGAIPRAIARAYAEAHEHAA